MDIDLLIESSGNIFTTSFLGGEVSFTYRMLTQKEYRAFNGLRNANLISEWTLYDTIFDRCYMGNSKLISTEIPFGMTLTIGKLIMYISGDCDQETLTMDIHTARVLNPNNTVHEYMRASIVTAFPSYKIEDIESWTRSDFIKKFVISENVLTKQNPEYAMLNLSEIKSREEYEQSEKSKKKKDTNIDFNRQNAQIQKAMGPWKNEEAQSLERKQARALDRRR